ncbi:MAG TPA: MFS transporter [Galbitalea sp.]
MTSARSAGASDLDNLARWRAFFVCIGVGALTILDLSGVNVALPSIQKSLHANSTELQLIVAGYTLAFGLALVPAGRLGDNFSRRTFFVVGLSGFTIASALCAVAPNEIWLTTARLIQGLAAGVQMPQVLGMNQQLFRGEERGRAFGIFGGMIGVATALGPTLGGLVIGLGGTTNGWRLLFAINVPLGIAAIIFSLRLLPKNQDRGEGNKELDPVGVVLLGIAIFCFMLPFLLTTGGKGDDPLRWFWLAGSVAGAVAFVLWEKSFAKRKKSPIVHFELFAMRSFRNGLLVATTYFAGMPAAFLITTLFLQEGLRRSPLLAGLVVVPFAVTSGTAAVIGGRLLNRFGRALVVVGIATVIVGVSLTVLAAQFAPPSTIEWFMGAGLLVGGAGGGLVISPNQTLTLSEIPVVEGSAAGSMTQLGQRLGTAVGVSAVTAIFFGVLSTAGNSMTAYQAAFRDGFFVTIGLLAISLVIGIIDLRQRDRGNSTSGS